MIRNATARQLLYAWHGGQWSPTYAAASSGLVADWPDLIEEVAKCYAHPTVTARERRDLVKLQIWLAHQRGASTLWIDHPADGRTYSALPWSKRYD